MEDIQVRKFKVRVTSAPGTNREHGQSGGPIKRNEPIMGIWWAVADINTSKS